MKDIVKPKDHRSAKKTDVLNEVFKYARSMEDMLEKYSLPDNLSLEHRTMINKAWQAFDEQRSK